MRAEPGALNAAAVLLLCAWSGPPLRVDAGTRVDKRPRSGDYVEVRGTVQSDGAVYANRIRRR